jgi:hypothetical protein
MKVRRPPSLSLSDFLGTETEQNQALKMVEAGGIEQDDNYAENQAIGCVA